MTSIGRGDRMVQDGGTGLWSLCSYVWLCVLENLIEFDPLSVFAVMNCSMLTDSLDCIGCFALCFTVLFNQSSMQGN